jgi:SAM-dependent methyltransferase
MVKYELLERLATKFTANSWVVDLGCGKGQDLAKYIKMPTIKNTLFIDNNENNLCSIIERKYTNNTNNSLGIFVQNLDLNSDGLANYSKIKANIPMYQKIETKLIVCNFAIHYFVKDNLDNFIDLVDSMLPSGGRFLFTCLNGEEIYKLLQDNEFKPWGDGKKYLIKPQFANKKFRGGEDIDILLPFSNNTLYRESLVNLALVEKKLKKKKIMLESQANFGDIYLSKFRESDPLSSQLDSIDLEYIKLVWFSIYYKK